MITAERNELSKWFKHLALKQKPIKKNASADEFIASSSWKKTKRISRRKVSPNNIVYGKMQNNNPLQANEINEINGKFCKLSLTENICIMYKAPFFAP